MNFKAPLVVFFSALLIAFTAQAEGRTINLVGFGDSLMAGYELAANEAFPIQLEALLRSRGQNVAISNAGVSGDTTADGLARLVWSVPEGTDGVILALGANDALRGLSPEETRVNLEAIIARLTDRGIDILLVGMMAPPNMGADYEAAFNPIFPELAKAHGLIFHPFMLDGVALDPALKLKDNMHPNAGGTRMMAEKILPTATEFLEKIRKKQ
jgi:acyl-CoA thioesterase-1